MPIFFVIPPPHAPNLDCVFQLFFFRIRKIVHGHACHVELGSKDIPLVYPMVTSSPCGRQSEKQKKSVYSSPEPQAFQRLSTRFVLDAPETCKTSYHQRCILCAPKFHIRWCEPPSDVCAICLHISYNEDVSWPTPRRAQGPKARVHMTMDTRSK